jgi:TerC family integral membrane protein
VRKPPASKFEQAPSSNIKATAAKMQRMCLAIALVAVALVAARPPQPRAKPLALRKARGRAAARPLVSHETALQVSGGTVSHETALQVSGGTIAKASDAEMRQAVITTIGVVLSACAFGVGVAVTRGKEVAMEFFAGYLVEQSLSVDNLFVFILLFEYFRVPASMQEKALRWGIIGALLMRGVMILVGVELVQRFRVVTLLFAGVLLASAVKLLSEGDHDDEEMNNNAMVKLSKSFCKSVSYYDGDKFFTKLRDGSRAATPLLLCVVCIELSDFVFAVDSIPAVLAITKDPFIVYSSNIFAIAALRSLYQVLSAAIAGLPYLRPAVALILGFVGLKMLAEYYHIHVPTSWSLGVIVATLGGGIALSLWWPPPSPKK